MKYFYRLKSIIIGRPIAGSYGYKANGSVKAS